MPLLSRRRSPGCSSGTGCAPDGPPGVRPAGSSTIEPGKLIVAFNGDLPMTSLQDGQIVGIDGEMISYIAAKLGLEIVPQQMDWAAAIESTSVGHVDLMLGAMGWTVERTEVMLLSDPIYYFGVLLAQKTANNYHTFADMAGKKVGTVVGFSLVPELKAVPGVGEVRLYDTSDGALRDLIAGRLDIAILDPPLGRAGDQGSSRVGSAPGGAAARPAFPIMSTKYNATMAIRMEDAALADAINAEIANLWMTCKNQQIMASTA